MEAANRIQRTICNAESVGVVREAISTASGVSKSGGAKRAPADVKNDAARRNAVKRGGGGGGRGGEFELGIDGRPGWALSPAVSFSFSFWFSFFSFSFLSSDVFAFIAGQNRL